MPGCRVRSCDAPVPAPLAAYEGARSQCARRAARHGRSAGASDSQRQPDVARFPRARSSGSQSSEPGRRPATCDLGPVTDDAASAQEPSASDACAAPDDLHPDPPGAHDPRERTDRAARRRHASTTSCSSCVAKDPDRGRDEAPGSSNSADSSSQAVSRGRYSRPPREGWPSDCGGGARTPTKQGQTIPRRRQPRRTRRTSHPLPMGADDHPDARPGVDGPSSGWPRSTSSTSGSGRCIRASRCSR